MSTTAERLSAALADRYRIERELGAGGMATVYLASDLKHDRKVAIKVLKPELAAVLGAERFVQEIKTTAALSHPHILPLFDSGEADGFLYYVMPYLQGETIREKLNRETQFGIDEAVKIATEVAEALDYAHQHGVIHRDIKPENILLHAGRPMVMDFGIALAVSAAAGGRMTETGLSLGTPHYMSPEQATADRDISARSDIYSLASVLYEMLTGNPPHMGSSAQQIIMKIIAEPVQPVTAFRKNVAPNVAAALAVALEKLPADRFDSAARFAEALHNPAFHGATSATRAMATADSRSDWRTRAAIPLAVLSVLLLALAVTGWMRRQPSPVPAGRFEVPLQSSRMMGVGGVAISPDGRVIAYMSPTQGVIIRPRSELVGTRLSGVTVEAAWAPFFSPDGTRLAYETGFPGSLIESSITGGASKVIVPDSTSGYGGAFGSDGSIYYSSARGVLMRVPSDGGVPRVVARPDSTNGQSMLLSPDVLPGDRAAIVTIFGAGRPKIGVVDFASSSVRVLTDGIIARFAEPDYVFVGRDNGDLVAIPFDPRRLETTGPEVVMGDKMRSSFGGYTTSLSISKSGDIAYLAANVLDGMIVRVDRTGRVTPTDPDWRDLFSGLALSPDGRSLAVSRYLEGRDEIWLKTLDRGPLLRLSYGGILSYRPTWSPDGHFIYFITDRDASRPAAVYRVSASGGGEAERMFETTAPIDEAEWSRDGKWLVYRSGSGGGRDIYAKRWGSDEPPVPIAASEFEERAPTVSPDGRFIAYVSDESGRPEVYVRPFPDATTAKWPVSRRGGSEPRWANNGRELFYRSAENMLVSVRLAPGPGFSISSEEPLFSTRTFHDEGMHSLYDVQRDDRGFLFIQLQGEVRGRIVVIQNWRQAVEQRRTGMRP